MTVAVYPGSFDPVTIGHLDIAGRAAGLFDRLILAVYETPPKAVLFSLQERLDMLRRACSSLPEVQVVAFSGLIIDYCRRAGAKVIVRGLRMTSDFEREFEMALMNKNLAPEIEVVCLMARTEYQFLSSSLVKEVAGLGGSIESLVPPHVASALQAKLPRLKEIQTGQKGG
ncbi:MAG: pantetheine-phosphate adenylyltransferase [Chloroflexota bacterium]